MEKHEMTAREFIKERRRLCNASDCDRSCPIFQECGNYDITERCVDIVEKWAERHPETLLVPVGDGIYFDPKHRIVPDEMTRAMTVVFTFNNYEEELSPEELKEYGARFERELKWHMSADDIHVIDVKQFVTKCHEEEA